MLADLGQRPCVLDAQAHLAEFYRGFGFVTTGPSFDWDGVPHLPMRRAVDEPAADRLTGTGRASPPQGG